MHEPPLVGWLMVVMSGSSGVYCLLRLRSRSPELRHSAAGEALMALGMAAMALPVAAVGSQPWVAAVFAGVFAGAALRGLLLARAGAHHLHHAVGSLAMVYMALALAGGGGGQHAGHGAGGTAGGIPPLTGALLAYFAVYVLRAGVRIAPVAAAASAAGTGAARPAWVDRPELATACRVSMAMAMFAMLLTV